MLTDHQAARYLERIGYRGDTASTRATLDALHHAHLMQVPFENFDVTLGTPIVLSLDAFYDKIVERKRGGFCYELNSLFGALLQTLGFKPDLLAAGVFKGDIFGDPLDHLLLGVHLNGDTLIADVGFGDCFRNPLALDGGTSRQLDIVYSIEAAGGNHILYARKPGEEQKSQYRFSTTPHALADFTERCNYQQTSPNSHFTQRAACTAATETGRITLSNGRYIVTTDGSRSEWEIADEAEYRAILQHDFGIALGEHADISRLLPRKT
jgi:N-hydroxyarylamine O-acetyltransferase